MSKGFSYHYSGTKGHIVSVASSLPSNPNTLLSNGWIETTHPKQASNSSSRVFTEESTGLRIRFDKGDGNKNGYSGIDHYHIDHASSELESITRKDISNRHFRFSEHYNTGTTEFDRDIIVNWDKNTDTFFFRIFVDGKEVYSKLCNSYEEFVEVAEGYMFLPGPGTEEYNDLLTESLSIADEFKLYENLWD